MYALDKLTTELHFQNIKKLVKVLNRLAEKGHTVLIIEHDLDVIKVFNHVIDIKPEGGQRGGNIIAEVLVEKMPTTARK